MKESANVPEEHIILGPNKGNKVWHVFGPITVMINEKRNNSLKLEFDSVCNQLLVFAPNDTYYI